jgi:hypothetical protein
MSPLQAATVNPARRVLGRLPVPGDKSRMLLICMFGFP